MSEACPVCGSKVKVVGKSTMSYEVQAPITVVDASAATKTLDKVWEAYHAQELSKKEAEHKRDKIELLERIRKFMAEKITVAKAIGDDQQCNIDCILPEDAGAIINSELAKLEGKENLSQPTEEGSGDEH